MYLSIPFVVVLFLVDLAALKSDDAVQNQQLKYTITSTHNIDLCNN
jgi:hypothetical protein